LASGQRTLAVLGLEAIGAGADIAKAKAFRQELGMLSTRTKVPAFSHHHGGFATLECSVLRLLSSAFPGDVATAGGDGNERYALDPQEVPIKDGSAEVGYGDKVGTGKAGFKGMQCEIRGVVVGWQYMDGAGGENGVGDYKSTSSVGSLAIVRLLLPCNRIERSA